MPLLTCAALLACAATACHSDDTPSVQKNPSTPAAPKPVPALADASGPPVGSARTDRA
ncbi:hypothetical protein ACIQH7_09975 [Streptomyces anulatus]|uniref:hypothetical protein n=1 Tax=Streptomyces sp. NPDC088719 TaxID=3365872 RepID=UPI0037F41EFF